MMNDTTLPSNVIELQKMVVDLQGEVAALSELVRFLRASRFGTKSEQSHLLGQGSLFEGVESSQPVDEAEEIKEEPKDSPKDGDRKGRRKPGRRPLPDHLKRVDVLHDLEDADKVCSCGHDLKRIGEETCEKLEIPRVEPYVVRHIRPKYACPSCEGLESLEGTVHIAPNPPQLLPKTILTASLAATLIVSKYADAIPYYRQEKLFSRIGVDLSRATMSNWTIKLAERLKPLWQLMEDEARSGPLIQMDETSFQVMREPDRSNRTKSYMWVARGGTPDRQLVIYKYHQTREGSIPRAWLKPFKGFLQTDDYAGYNALSKRKDIVRVGCMAHVRRKFFDVIKANGSKDSGDGLANKAITFIRSLYLIEREARQHDGDYDEIFRLRQEKAKPIFKTLNEWVEANKDKVPPKSLLGKAFHYASHELPKIEHYLESGIVPIDNNRVENDIRPFVLGRKNWMFAGKPEGAEASALFFSLIETAKANGLEPYQYLRYVFDQLPYTESIEDYAKLLPTNVLKESFERAQ